MDSIFSKKKVKNNEDEEGSGVTAILDVFGNGQVGSPETRVSFNVNFSELSTGCPIRSETWLGRHRFHCTVLPRCPINSAKFPSPQAELGRQWNLQNQSQPNPGLRPVGKPCSRISVFPSTRKLSDLGSKTITQRWCYPNIY